LLQIFLLSVAAIIVVGSLIFGFFYIKYADVVDQRLKNPIFANRAQIYAAPREVRVGQKMTAALIGDQLRQAGYSEGTAAPSQLGTYTLHGGSITIHPGPQSYHSADGATINTSGGQVESISGDASQPLAAYELEPSLITGLSGDKERSKRRLVKYDEMPPNLVKAVIAIEDRRFFEHNGVDYIRLAGALRNDLESHRRAQGGSTLTMQLARGLFLTQEKKIKRKLVEIMITFQLEHRYTKKEIFELYANQINLGQRGSFAIDGFGEAAQAYFGKDIRKLDLAESALLAGMIQQPNFRSPYKHPDRAIARRNVVLDAMVETNAISPAEAERAKAEPLRLAPLSVDAGEAPYFVDQVREALTQRFGDRDINREGLRIYTSLDPGLQRIATEAVEAGMHNVDELVRARYSKKNKKGETVMTKEDIQYPQVALVALNPHTGQVLAMVGGRNYGTSQLNHAVSRRPTGSIFKPFVYAAAFNSDLSGRTLSGQPGAFTPVSYLNDVETDFNGYTPRNYKDEYHGEVTAIYALAHSLNNATISLAQSVGFDTVASLAREAGIKSARGTASVALGAYDATPLDMAGAYTIFANNGVHIQPWTIASVRQNNGDIIKDYPPDSNPVLDPRVAYMTTYLMEGVMNFGYGYEVRKRGFMAPAAGKTGTSHDAWFAGYTSNLICVIWVGNDDYSDVKLAGAQAAAPIWAEFMKRAVTLPQYSDTQPFSPPAGIVQVSVDKATNLLADESCPGDTWTVAFMEGTEPKDTCSNPNGADQRNIFQKIFGLGGNQQPPLQAPLQQGPPPAEPVQSVEAAQPVDGGGEKAKKPGFFGRLFGRKPKDQPPAQTQQQPPQ
jgi:penicillin-binding protein 1B